jgi:hypothetical protein
MVKVGCVVDSSFLVSFGTSGILFNFLGFFFGRFIGSVFQSLFEVQGGHER